MHRVAFYVNKEGPLNILATSSIELEAFLPSKPEPSQQEARTNKHEQVSKSHSAP